MGERAARLWVPMPIRPAKPWLPYVAPFGVYFVFLLIQARWTTGLVWLYPIKTLAVAVTLWIFRRDYEELRWPWKTPGALVSLLLATVIGLVVIVIWIGLDPFYPKLSNDEPFNPHTLRTAATMGTFIGFRVAGAVLVVPPMEELFWRAFLIRWLVKEDFKQVPVGWFTWQSFAITVVMFGAEHNQWLAGLICGALYNWLLYRRKDVFSCVWAHAVSNAALAAWVLARGDWKFW